MIIRLAKHDDRTEGEQVERVEEPGEQDGREDADGHADHRHADQRRHEFPWAQRADEDMAEVA
jgi:hypothetical protein